MKPHNASSFHGIATPDEYRWATQAFGKNIQKGEEVPIVTQKEADVKKANTSLSLAVPGDIQNPVDSADLVAQLLERNSEKVYGRKEKIWLKKQVSEANTRIDSEYEAKARAAYQKQWRECKKMGGHSRINSDIGGYTVLLCECCGHAQDTGVSYENGQASYVNDEIIRILKKEMMKVDEEAGLLVYPKEKDFVFSEYELIKSTPKEAAPKVKTPNKYPSPKVARFYWKMFHPWKMKEVPNYV